MGNNISRKMDIESAVEGTSLVGSSGISESFISSSIKNLVIISVYSISIS